MSDVIPFFFGADAVRVIKVGSDPWFVARDVAAVLGYAVPDKAVRDHCKGATDSVAPTAGGAQRVKIIPERDVYRLVMRSKLPAAEKFEEWVVGEVLPTIRKTGSFVQGAVQALDDPAALRTLLLGYTEKVIALESTVAAQAPKVAALDRIATASDGSCSVTEAAKNVGMKPKAFFEWMRAHRWIYRHALSSTWLAYQPRLDSGHLEHKVVTFDGSEGPRTITQVRVTSKGLARIAELLEQEKMAA